MIKTHSIRPLNSSWDTTGIIDSILRLSKTCKRARWILKKTPWCLNECFEQAAFHTGSAVRLATIRVSLGDVLEAHASEQAMSILHPSSPKSVLVDQNDLGKLCQLYFDAYAVAVWTSVHAEYLHLSKQTDDPIPSPTLFLVPNTFTQLDLLPFYERRGVASMKLLPKEAISLVQLVTRCTNPGARGWEPVVQNAIKDSVGKRVLIKELEICLSGLHPAIHPSLRPNWKHRFNVFHTTGTLLWDTECHHELQKSSLYLKDAMKRFVGTMLSNAPAMCTSLACFAHPCVQLQQPPFCFCHIGLETAMVSFVMASKDIVDGAPLSNALEKQFYASTISTTAMKWAAGWLGKGTINVPNVMQLVPFVESVFMCSFKSPFLGLWVHGKTKDIRLSKLDSVQHKAINELTAATKLCSLLSSDAQLQVQRLALKCPIADLLSIQQALCILGYNGSMLKFMNIKHLNDILIEIKSIFGVDAVSKLLFFAKVAWLKSTMLMVQFADGVVESHCETVLKRLKHPMPIDLKAKNLLDHVYLTLPAQATCLCICTECQRVANATVVSGVADEIKITTFNELGVSQAMVRYSLIPETKACVLCARRSSAAFRASAAFQNSMAERHVECDSMDQDAIRKLITENHFEIASKLRRDSKNAMEQRSVSDACGSKNMLQIPILGRAIRIFGSFFTHCGFCACLIKLSDIHRFKNKICCLRCDEKMIGLEAPAPAPTASSSQPAKIVCRYCGAGTCNTHTHTQPPNFHTHFQN